MYIKGIRLFIYMLAAILDAILNCKLRLQPTSDLDARHIFVKTSTNTTKV